MKTLPSQKDTRSVGSYEFGTLLLLALFVVPLALHVLANLAV
jgi:hypothetical protein